ncbi:gas vesicle structural protein GvpA [Actinoallomurus sp. NBC_01490]|uniref:gas vesicle protein GvpJ n=1 Tax=Actinoallomurus sp. NBC_01490 TaxID=2903557 RepID=UPI002E34B305|nr:gas vesicle protein GvpJ [Actinoallomurus sp. NBC_01490]
MTVSPYEAGSGPVQRSSGSALVDVIDTILDKGLVIDAFVRVSLVGIELITIDARIVVASVDTYLRFAEATNRLDLYEKGGTGLPGLVGELTEKGTQGGAKGKTKGMLDAARETVGEVLEERAERAEERDTRRRSPRRERER